MSRGLKFRIKDVEKLYCPCSENKDAGLLPNDNKLICAYVLAYAKGRISHAAQLSINLIGEAVVLTHTHKVKNRVTSVMLSEV